MPDSWDRGLPPREPNGWLVLAVALALLAGVVYLNVRI